jgi:hypothetical protein
MTNLAIISPLLIFLKRENTGNCCMLMGGGQYSTHNQHNTALQLAMTMLVFYPRKVERLTFQKAI